MMINRLVLIGVAITACSSFGHAQDQTSPAGHQVNYPSGWDHLVSAWRQVEEAEHNEKCSYVATVEAKLKTAGGRISEWTNVWTIRTKPGYKYMIASLDGEESVYARTPDYVFSIKRRAKESEWKLVHLSKDTKSEDARRFEESLPGVIGLSVLYPLGTMLEKERCSKYFDGEYRKKHLKELNFIDGEKPLLEWSLDYPYHGSLVMDPAPNYIVRQFESKTDVKQVPRRTTLVRELMDDAKRPSSSLPLCKSIAYKLVDGGETMNDVRITFSDYSFDPPPDDFFRLSHYGLPESLAASDSSSKLWLWLLVVAAACLAAAFLFRRLSRRPAKLHPTRGKQ